MTGLSGAGRSVAIKSLDDLGFYCIDNLPVELFEPTVEHFKAFGTGRNLALGLDLRNLKSVDELEKLKASINQSHRCDLIFLTADEDVLALRYGSTRRKHPLLDTGGQLTSAIRRERTAMSGVGQIADACFDTSFWSPHQLGRAMEERYRSVCPGRQLHVTLFSFGFKYGQLTPCDTMLDVRFLKNPYFSPELKHKTGMDADVLSYIMSDPVASEFLKRSSEFIRFLLPRYYDEGKHYFRIGVGCTGGQHRSVAVAECLARELDGSLQAPVLFSVIHRDLHFSSINSSARSD